MSESTKSCPYCNGWGIEPNDDFSPCRNGCKEHSHLGTIKGIIKEVSNELASDEKNTNNQDHENP
jgi:hypothetical protein